MTPNMEAIGTALHLGASDPLARSLLLEWPTVGKLSRTAAIPNGEHVVVATAAVVAPEEVVALSQVV